MYRVRVLKKSRQSASCTHSRPISHMCWRRSKAAPRAPQQTHGDYEEKVSRPSLAAAPRKARPRARGRLCAHARLPRTSPTRMDAGARGRQGYDGASDPMPLAMRWGLRRGGRWAKFQKRWRQRLAGCVPRAERQLLGFKLHLRGQQHRGSVFTLPDEHEPWLSEARGELELVGHPASQAAPTKLAPMTKPGATMPTRARRRRTTRS